MGSCVIIDEDRKGVVTALHGTSHLEVLFTADMASERVAVERLKANEQDEEEEEEEEDTAEAGGDAACAPALADHPHPRVDGIRLAKDRYREAVGEP